MANIFASKVDYAELLFQANENKKTASNKNTPSYKTDFSPPKKLEKSVVSSENIKKFLERKEEEERKRNEEARRRKEELMALRSRDKKALRRVQIMCKTTKSANKSVLPDAVDNLNATDSLNSFKQCDEDDYGFVSQEASDFYNKMLKKYETLSNEDSLSKNIQNNSATANKRDGSVTLKPSVTDRQKMYNESDVLKRNNSPGNLNRYKRPSSLTSSEIFSSNVEINSSRKLKNYKNKMENKSHYGKLQTKLNKNELKFKHFSSSRVCDPSKKKQYSLKRRISNPEANDIEDSSRNYFSKCVAEIFG